ncbi:cryptococcal mannosyltransferase 1-domain-containing protein [Exophiala viscosa]|uniref:Cryptococcal mannosyltransferase 1-domain-containing protein n=1 Tax=Exophiala viscosa TaxID=2486360 RepID=A0AAN6E0S2_9EURO|nr:cryptococcal mannosyltransferase 1-domain-containing protein [Exophiala viscosa]
MLLRTYRRSRKRRLLWVAFYLTLAALTFDVLTILKQYREFSRNLVSHTFTEPSTLPSPIQNQKIFICAQFWTSAQVIQDRWGQALLDLIGVLGKQNVYVSIYESGSLDNTKDILRELEKVLVENNIPRSVILDPTTHEDEVNAGPLDEQGTPRSGWIQTTTVGVGKEMRRIPYLARLRNKSLKPLFDMHSQGQDYDKILFLNDVVFRPSDVLSLLATNQGSFSAACAMDFHYPPAYYDTFALRDSEGYGSIMTSFPYFRSPDSREAMLQGRATKVQSCWNGMIAMDTGSFYEGLRFRALPDSLASKHLEASECCLIHTDMTAMNLAGNGIYMNPSVRVGYTVDAYNLTHAGPEKTFVSSTQYVKGVWLNRIRRTVLPTVPKVMKEIDRKIARWKKEGENSLEKREETGQLCIIDEQHILIWNGWKHV